MTTVYKSRFDLLKAGAIGTILFFAAVAICFLYVYNRPQKSRSLDDIRRSGILRVLTTPESDLRGLQRGVTPIDLEMAMLSAFAEETGVTLQIVYVAAFSDLPAALASGRGDLIADNLTMTPEREKRFLFSNPFAVTRNVVVTSEKTVLLPPDARIAAQSGTLHAELLKEFPDARTFAVPAQPEDLIAQMADGVYDAVLTDDNFLRGYLRYRGGVHTVKVLENANGIAWAMPKDAKALKAKLDDFLARKGRLFREDASTADLPSIRERKLLRVLTRDNPVNYYTERGGYYGFEYELAKRFADSLRLQLVMVTPPTHDQLIPYLNAGRGDIIAASLSITEERRKTPNLVFSTPYLEAREVLVQRKDAPPIRKVSDLEKRTILIRRDSSYNETLAELRAKGVKFHLQYVTPEVESNEIVDMVAAKKADVTLIDNLIVRNSVRNGRSEVESALVLSPMKRYAWAVRANNPLLLAAVNEFLEREVNTAAFKSAFDRYFTGETESGAEEASLPGADSLPPFAALMQQAAKEYYFDWRLIAAQVCQESRFRADSVAPDGGAGLLQIMPDTIREMRCRDPFDPKQNLNAGTGYLAKQRDRLGPEVKTMDRIYFALASYNGGYGHLCDARLLARELGKDPDVWFGNVEEAMKLLSCKAYYSRARYGYCRSGIIVNYVRQIRDRFETYRNTFPR